MIDKQRVFLVIEMTDGERHNYWLGNWKDLFSQVQDVITKLDDKEDTISLSREIDPRQETFLEKEDIRMITIIN